MLQYVYFTSHLRIRELMTNSHTLSYLETGPYRLRASDLTYQLFFACLAILVRRLPPSF